MGSISQFKVRSTWALRVNGVIQKFGAFDEMWTQALAERAANKTPTVAHWQDGEWVDLHQIMLPSSYCGRDDQMSRVRILVEKKIVLAELRTKLGLEENADISSYL